MTVRSKTRQPKKWTREDEENLALEISEDKRLLRLGINPDGNPVQNMLKVIQLAESLHAKSE
jgi:hypothetical protein